MILWTLMRKSRDKLRTGNDKGNGRGDHVEGQRDV